MAYRFYREKDELNGWIPVSKLPEVGDEYNVVMDFKDGGKPVSGTLEYRMPEKAWFYPGSEIQFYDVLYWQPLPVPPYYR